MRLPSNRQCAVEGDGKKMDQAPPFRNPFVHVLKFTPMEKAKVKLCLQANCCHHHLTWAVFPDCIVAFSDCSHLS
uniref:Uncharacterized protein n=1 Tax=Sander lucioperca TaxID=283035 RepID=A0A8C9XH73_SANLU